MTHSSAYEEYFDVTSTYLKPGRWVSPSEALELESCLRSFWLGERESLVDDIRGEQTGCSYVWGVELFEELSAAVRRLVLYSEKIVLEDPLVHALDTLRLMHEKGAIITPKSQFGKI